MTYPKEKIRIIELTIKSFEGEISKEEFAELDSYVSSSKEKACYYASHIKTCMNIFNYEEVNVDEYIPSDLSFDLELWQELARYEENSPTIEIPKEEQRSELVQKLEPVKVKRKISKFSLITSFLSAAAMILVLAYANYAQNKEEVRYEVATLVDQVNIEWADAETRFDINSRFWTGQDLLCLKKGIVRIRHDEGVDVVIEGPALFRVERSGIYCEYGRLYSHVTERGLGFTIKTPTSQFIDLGTEFGVQADIDGTSELHVMKGQVQLFAGPIGGAKLSQKVTVNKAMRFEACSGQIKSIPIKKYVFARQINSKTGIVWRGQDSIDLADIIGGGNGFGTGQSRTGVDSLTGKLVMNPKPKARKWGKKYITCEHPAIDGTFVPDAGNGAVVVSSEGHVFKDCPDTTGSLWGDIMSDGWQPNPNFEEYRLRLSGYDWGVSANRPAIGIHSNQGITFDLDVIREFALPFHISRFSTVLGISGNRIVYRVENKHLIQFGDATPKADVWILIDGEVRFSRMDITGQDEGIPASIDITDNDRFFTVIVTDGSDGEIVNDWVIFTNPSLALQ